MKSWFFIICILAFMAVGCEGPLKVPNVAQPLETKSQEQSISQYMGFGELPKLPARSGTIEGDISLNTDLPSLPKNTIVLRIPGSALDDNSFQNLTNAIGMPIGMLGEDFQNIDFDLRWTNAANEQWSYDSGNKKLTFVANGYSAATTDNWPDNVRLQSYAYEFMRQIGVSESMVRNVHIDESWQSWADSIKTTGCADSESQAWIIGTNDPIFALNNKPPQNAKADECAGVMLPNLIMISMEMVLDGNNIVDETGKPEEAARLLIDAVSGKTMAAVVTLPYGPMRSDYPAISEATMKQRMLSGGIGKIPPGILEINRAFFAYTRLTKRTAYEPDYLVPAVVGEGVHVSNGISRPYRIVVPVVEP